MDRPRLLRRGEDGSVSAQCDDDGAAPEAQEIVDRSFRFSGKFERGRVSGSFAARRRRDLLNVWNVSFAHHGCLVLVHAEDARQREQLQRGLAGRRGRVQDRNAMLEPPKRCERRLDGRLELADEHFRLVEQISGTVDVGRREGVIRAGDYHNMILAVLSNVNLRDASRFITHPSDELRIDFLLVQVLLVLAPPFVVSQLKD